MDSNYKVILVTLFTLGIYPFFMSLSATITWEYLKHLQEIDSKGYLNIKTVTVYDFLSNILHPLLFALIITMFLPTCILIKVIKSKITEEQTTL